MNSASVFAVETLVVDFSRHGIEAFEEEKFVGKTDYQLVDDNGVQVLRARTADSASVLYREMDFDLEKTPFLNWSWRISSVFSITDQKKKRGDDYPARIYVVVKEGFFPWQTKALNYVWSNYETDEKYWANPFTSKAVMIPVRGGKKELNQWQNERVNVVEDFYRAFGRRITSADGIAIMSDSDNAGGVAEAFYGKIFFSD
ncbi:MAG: DUF3047 domain-containing protein [Oceanicoccus sp.]